MSPITIVHRICGNASQISKNDSTNSVLSYSNKLIFSVSSEMDYY
jgi:hypothetical protein